MIDFQRAFIGRPVYDIAVGVVGGAYPNQRGSLGQGEGSSPCYGPAAITRSIKREAVQDGGI